eukprot:IDg20532t1
MRVIFFLAAYSPDRTMSFLHRLELALCQSKDSCKCGHAERWRRYADAEIREASARSAKYSPARPTEGRAHEREVARSANTQHAAQV